MRRLLTKRVTGTRLICLAMLAIATIAATGAPADQYFGQLKMSALRIRYEMAQVKAHYESHKLLPEEAAHLAVLDENAFEDWASRYPHDDWLASTAYNLAKLYEELPGTDAQQRAVHLLTYVKSHFPGTHYATLASADLHKGVPVRSDPAWAVSMRAARAASPSASPAPAASPSPRTSPAASPSVSASPAPPSAPPRTTATASPAASASPG